MMEQPLLFDGSPGFGDTEYLAHIQYHPDHVVANIPNPAREFAGWEIKIHRATCFSARNDRLGSLTEETQHKLVWDNLNRLRLNVEQQYPRNDVSLCENCFRGA